MWHTQAWRLSTVGDALKFKIIPNHDYYGHVGHKFWSKSVVSAKDKSAKPTQSGYSGQVRFTLDGATAITLGLSAAATALALF